ncbi:hypothetical protein PV646_02375 [Streptomyces sp. ID05-26A]|nr:hypothetical protein [Streptomyces sp. ID05-26A]
MLWGWLHAPAVLLELAHIGGRWREGLLASADVVRRGLVLAGAVVRSGPRRRALPERSGSALNGAGGKACSRWRVP